MSSALLSMTQAAQVVGVRRQAIHLAILGGRLKAERHGPYWLIEPAEAERYGERSRNGPEMIHRQPKYRVWARPAKAVK